MQDHRHRLMKHLVQHAVTQEAVRIVRLGEWLGPRRIQILRKAARIQKDMVAEARVAYEQIGIAEIRIPHQRPDMVRPILPRRYV